MKINGREIAENILLVLRERTSVLKANGVTPHMYIILLTDNPSTISYIKQKQLYAQKIGAKITVDTDDPNISTERLIQKIESLNFNRSIHGIIVQRPIPLNIDKTKVNNSILSEKEIDGFGDKTKYKVPVANAINVILKNIQEKYNLNSPLNEWLKTKQVVIIGKGETAGAPIINSFKKQGIEPLVIDSKTVNKDSEIKKGDIVISAVGKSKVVNETNLKDGAILIGVGMHKEEDEKFHGDFIEEDILGIAAYYTPTPGGVGPVNVACLLQNLVEAADNSLK